MPVDMNVLTGAAFLTMFAIVGTVVVVALFAGVWAVQRWRA